MAADPRESPETEGWKSYLSKRLTREGRWDEFRKRRRAIENSGVEREEAWKLAAKEYPALGADAPAAAVAETVAEDGSDPAPKGRKRRVDLKRDAQWVYSKLVYLKQGKVGVDSAPSLGAWALGQQAVANPQWFFKEILSRFGKDQDQDEGGRFDDERDQFRLLEIFEREEREARAARLAETEGSGPDQEASLS
jgi:hypothetical protein